MPTDTRPRSPATRPRHRRTAAVVALAAAIAAGGHLLAGAPADRARQPVATDASAIWPRAQRSDMPGVLPDGTAFFPELFLDAVTVVGTAPI
jgi:hypothetical protein